MMRVRCACLIMAATACAPRSSVPPEGQATTSDTLPDAVTLYRSPCYAGCPVYSVSATADGLVRYDGRDGVRQRGTRTTRIPKARVDAVVRELQAAGYFEFADQYRPSEPVCGRYVPDAPTVITSVNIGGRTKRIEHDHGCGSAPLALEVLESRIDEVLGTGRWTGR